MFFDSFFSGGITVCFFVDGRNGETCGGFIVQAVLLLVKIPLIGAKKCCKYVFIVIRKTGQPLPNITFSPSSVLGNKPKCLIWVIFGENPAAQRSPNEKNIEKFGTYNIDIPVYIYIHLRCIYIYIPMTLCLYVYIYISLSLSYVSAFLNHFCQPSMAKWQVQLHTSVWRERNTIH